MWRTSWSERIERLDPERDAPEVHQLVCASEFPWDTLQALSFALIRTCAVPSTGALLDRTVMPIRWNAAYGWRPFTEREKRASVAYHRELGRRMGLRDLPETWQEWERLLDDHEASHFGWHPGGPGRRRHPRAVHDPPAPPAPPPHAGAGRRADAPGTSRC